MASAYGELPTPRKLVKVSAQWASAISPEQAPKQKSKRHQSMNFLVVLSRNQIPRRLGLLKKLSAVAATFFMLVTPLSPASAAPIVVVGQAQSPWTFWVPTGISAEVGQVVDLMVDTDEDGTVETAVQAEVEFVFAGIPFQEYPDLTEVAPPAADGTIGNVIRFTTSVFDYAHLTEMSLEPYSFIYEQYKVEGANYMWIGGDDQQEAIWVPASSQLEVGDVVNGIWLDAPGRVISVSQGNIDCAYYEDISETCPQGSDGLIVQFEGLDGGAFDYSDYARDSSGSGIASTDFIVVGELVPVEDYQGGSENPTSNTGDVERVVAKPYIGPIVNPLVSPASPGQEVTFTGDNLEDVEGVYFGDVTGEIVSSTNSTLTVVVPVGISGVIDMTVLSPSGRVLIQQAISIAEAAQSGPSFGTKRYGDSVKVYAFNPVSAGKVQFFVNGEEVAWVNAVSSEDAKLRMLVRGELTTPYLVRTISLKPGKNVIEVYVDGTRVKRVAYSGL